MVDFRKWFPVLAVVALLLGTSVTASAQTALSCVTNAGVPPLLRAEGITELVGDVFMACTTPGNVAGPMFKANVQVFLDTNITSRITSGSTTEALLLLDELAPNGNTVKVGVNAFQGQKASDNSIVWLGVPITPLATTFSMRITNVRANASAKGVGSLIPIAVNMYISISGSQSVAVNNPTQVVGYTQNGLDVTVDKAANALQCVTGTATATINFKEKFATAFKRQIDATQDPSTVNVPYNTESGFVNSSIWGTSSTTLTVGKAKYGTRLIAKFTNVQAGVKVTVPKSIASPAARLVSVTDPNGEGGDASVDISDNTVVLTGGTGYATYEIITAGSGQTQVDPFAIDGLAVPVTYTWTANPAAGVPGLGVTQIYGNFAPISNVFVMSSSASIPRFIDNFKGGDAFTVVACATNLLFPYVAAVGQFDTGIAIANTSKDPFGTSGQTGKCEIYYYGNITVPTQTSVAVAPGQSIAFSLLAGGADANIAAAPGFWGYLIAKCAFQFAHGFAYISDVGSQKVAMGYLALVMDQSLYDSDTNNKTRTGNKSEPLNN